MWENNYLNLYRSYGQEKSLGKFRSFFTWPETSKQYPQMVGSCHPSRQPVSTVGSPVDGHREERMMAMAYAGIWCLSSYLIFLNLLVVYMLRL